MNSPLNFLEYKLHKFLSDTESSLSESDPDFDKGWEESADPSFGAFAGFFLDDDFRETLSPFLDVTFEGQATLLRDLCGSDSSEEICSDSFEYGFDPLDAFSSIPQRAKQLLQKHRNSELLHHIDNQIFSFAREGRVSFPVSLTS